MLVGRHERVLAIDGAYIHVSLNSSDFTVSVYISPSRSCPLQTKQKLYLIVVKPHPIISIALLPVSNLLNHPHHFALLFTVMGEINGMNLRLIMLRQLVS